MREFVSVTYCVECVRTLEPRGESNRYKVTHNMRFAGERTKLCQALRGHFAFIHFGINLAITVEVMYEGIPVVSALSAVSVC